MRKDELEFMEFISQICTQDFEEDFENWIVALGDAISDREFSPVDSSYIE